MARKFITGNVPVKSSDGWARFRKRTQNGSQARRAGMHPYPFRNISKRNGNA